MTKAIAVIGALYGDEGKGLMTDYFAHKHPKSIIIRSNGGAQAGHCQTGDTIITSSCGLRYISDMVGTETNNNTSFPLLNMHGDVENTSLLFTEHTKVVNKVDLMNGSSVKGTDAHAYYVWNGKLMRKEWVTTTKLDPSTHQFLIPKRLDNYIGTNPTVTSVQARSSHNNKQVRVDDLDFCFLALMMGLMNGDGYFGAKNLLSIAFHTSQQDVADYVKDKLIDIGLNPAITPHTSSKNCIMLKVHSVDLMAILTSQLGVCATQGANKQTPEFVMTGPKDIMANYIKGLMDADGTVKFHKSSTHSSSGQISFSNIASTLVTELQQLLYTLGIHSKIVTDKVRIGCQPSTSLIICSHDDIINYCNIIGFASKTKNDKCIILADTKKKTRNKNILGELVIIPPQAKKEIFEQVGNVVKLSGTIRSGFINNNNNKVIGDKYSEIKHLCANYHIVSISAVHMQYSTETVYDVTMPKTHSYIANGTISHNTVVTPEGERHVFSHFGSGSFVNTATYLSEFFVCNPMLYIKERTLLHDLGVFPTLVVHPDALVTTPFDMIVNMILEARRGADRHGSCGVGFGETIARSIAHKRLTIRDLSTLTRDELRARLHDIRSTYIPDRFKDQPLDRNTNSDASWVSILQNDELINDWVDAAADFISDVVVSDYDIITHDTIIFEGAQGLMLDQKSPDFPHVTRSNTGVTNVMAILKSIHKMVPDFELEDFEVVYVSRAYTTRHGAGPLDFEQELPYDITDQTNIPNINQGDLRFAPLLLDTLSSVTLHDFNQLSTSDNAVAWENDAVDRKDNADDSLIFNARVSMAFTCLDQIGETGFFIAGQALTSSPREDFIGLLTESSAYTSFGPTRDDIKSWD